MDFKEVAYSDIETKDLNKKIVEVKSARRHVVKVNNLEAEKNIFKNKSTMKTENLISSPVESIGIFCSEYIPNHFPDKKYIKYILNINGKDHEIEPVNSHRRGVKILKYDIFKQKLPSVELLNEEIKSAYLTIVIETPNNKETPFISDFKVLTSKGRS